MRVISQDGTIDVPYDICSFSISVVEYADLEQASIYCNDNHTLVVRKMATYSTDAKAQKAMALLRNKYAKHKSVFCFPSDEKLEAI